MVRDLGGAGRVLEGFWQGCVSERMLCIACFDPLDILGLRGVKGCEVGVRGVERGDGGGRKQGAREAVGGKYG